MSVSARRLPRASSSPRTLTVAKVLAACNPTLSVCDTRASFPSPGGEEDAPRLISRPRESQEPLAQLSELSRSARLEPAAHLIRGGGIFARRTPPPQFFVSQARLSTWQNLPRPGPAVIAWSLASIPRIRTR